MKFMILRASNIQLNQVTMVGLSSPKDKTSAILEHKVICEGDDKQNIKTPNSYMYHSQPGVLTCRWVSIYDSSVNAEHKPSKYLFHSPFLGLQSVLLLLLA